MKTPVFPETESSRRWYVIDASGQILGRLSARVAHVLRGKHKPIFDAHHDHGDHVIVINAEKALLTGTKTQTKQYFRHSTQPGHGKILNYKQMLAKDPERPIRKAVWGMLPKNSLGRKLYRKLHVYGGPSHPHEAQQPQSLGPGRI